jgi:hypothetical protein
MALRQAERETINYEMPLSKRLAVLRLMKRQMND